MVAHGKIDVHHHIIPDVFTDAMRKHGVAKVAGTLLPPWSAERSLAVMDGAGIERAVLSLSAPGVFFGDKADAVSLARACNETAAQAKRRYPGRFGSFAVLPTPFTHEACAEATYALDVLGAEGIVLLGSTEGVFLGDPHYDELMDELNRRDAIVFVHPNIHKTSTEIGLNIPGFFVEFLCDTSRAATNLIFSGAMERYPRIRWILSHAGGFMPFIAWRLALADGLPDLAPKIPKGVLTYLRRFYFDTALSPSPFALAALLQLVEPDHILFGSDFPFAPAPLVLQEAKAVDDLAILADAVRAGVKRGHALKLFPAFA